MIPTKTYPLSAIIGNQLTDKERIEELAEAFNKACDENADFVAQSVTDENRIAKLEAQLAAVTAERDGFRRDGEKYRRIAWLISSIFVHGGFKAETHNEAELEKLLRETGNFWESIADFDAALQPERRIEEGK